MYLRCAILTSFKPLSKNPPGKPDGRKPSLRPTWLLEYFYGNSLNVCDPVAFALAWQEPAHVVHPEWPATCHPSSVSGSGLKYSRMVCGGWKLKLQFRCHLDTTVSQSQSHASSKHSLQKSCGAASHSCERAHLMSILSIVTSLGVRNFLHSAKFYVIHMY